MTHSRVISLWDETKNKQQFQQKLEQQGFKKIGQGIRSTVFSREDVDYVVKVSDGLKTRVLEDPDLETFRLGYLYTNGNRQIGIQRKVDQSARKRCWNAIQKVVEANLWDWDIHPDNVGWLGEAPVIIDYM